MLQRILALVSGVISVPCEDAGMTSTLTRLMSTSMTVSPDSVLRTRQLMVNIHTSLSSGRLKLLCASLQTDFHIYVPRNVCRQLVIILPCMKESDSYTHTCAPPRTHTNARAHARTHPHMHTHTSLSEGNMSVKQRGSHVHI